MIIIIDDARQKAYLRAFFLQDALKKMYPHSPTSEFVNYCADSMNFLCTYRLLIVTYLYQYVPVNELEYE